MVAVRVLFGDNICGKPVAEELGLIGVFVFVIVCDIYECFLDASLLPPLSPLLSLTSPRTYRRPTSGPCFYKYHVFQRKILQTESHHHESGAGCQSARVVVVEASTA